MATRRWSSKTMRIRLGWLRGSINRVLLFRGRLFIAKPLSQIQRSTLCPLQGANLTPSIDGFGLRHGYAPIAIMLTPSSDIRFTTPRVFQIAKVSTDGIKTEGATT